MGGWKDLQDSVRPWTCTCLVKSSTLIWFIFWCFLPVCIITQVNIFGANNPLTNLVPSLQDVDPDDAFSSVPYEKGFALLYHLEELMGGPGNTWTHERITNCLTLKWVFTCLLVSPLQRCSWALWSRTSSCLPTAASLLKNGRTTCSPTSKTRWETPGCSAGSDLKQDYGREKTDTLWQCQVKFGPTVIGLICSWEVCTIQRGVQVSSWES